MVFVRSSGGHPKIHFARNSRQQRSALTRPSQTSPLPSGDDHRGDQREAPNRHQECLQSDNAENDQRRCDDQEPAGYLAPVQPPQPAPSEPACQMGMITRETFGNFVQSATFLAGQSHFARPSPWLPRAVRVVRRRPTATTNGQQI